MLKSLNSYACEMVVRSIFLEPHHRHEAAHRAKEPMSLGYGCPLPSARLQLPISHRHQPRQSPARVGGIPWLSLTCKPLALLVLLAVAVSPLQAQDPDPAAGLPVCDRTEQVRDAIVAAVDGVSNCVDITEADLAGIAQLFLGDESIRALQVGDFSGLAALNSLVLDNNSLTELPPKIFGGLADLRALFLRDNGLAALPLGVFGGLTDLESLYLNANSLTALATGVFTGLTELKTLQLSGNSLMALTASVFAGLRELSALHLNDNSLTTLPAGTFASLTALQLLHLNDNSLAALPAGTFAGLTALQSLLLNNNGLTALSAGAFAGLTKLRVLFLNDNNLAELPSGAFTGLLWLRSLNLRDNDLAELPASIFDGLAALRTLQLNNNNLAALPAGVFDDPYRLQFLHLESNRLTALPAGIFSGTRNLVGLHLQDNPGGEGFLPIASAGADQVVEAGQIAILTATVSDTDPWGDNVSYAWAQIDNGGDLVTLRDADTALPSFVMPAGATALEFKLTVTGRGGARYADTDSVTVRLPATVVTLAGPMHDLLPAGATAIVGNGLRLIYSYSADDLRGRVLTGSIEVAASIDGAAITHDIRIDGVRGEITVVLRRQAYPDPGEHELAVTLSAAAEGFVLAEPSSIATPFSFLPLPPTALEVRQAEGNQGKRGAVGSDAIELGYIFDYAAGNRLKRPRAGLSVQVDVELCADAGGGCVILAAASQALVLDGNGSLTLRVDRTAAALSVFGEADDDSIRHGRVLLRTAGDADFAAAAATTTFSFAVAAAVVTLSGPDLVVTTDIVGGKLSLVYGYSADDLHGRVLTGSIEVAAAIDGEAITPDIRIHGAIGEITIILSRAEYPEPGEHRLAVTLSLSATATGFVLGDPSSITTPFSFASVAVPDAVVTLSGPDLVVTTDIVGGKLSLVYSYSADDLHGRVLTGSIEVAAAIDGEVITPDIRIHGARGEITVVLRRQEYPDAGEHRLAVTLSLSATATGFVLGDPSSITTPFSFASVAVADAVVTLSGPDLVVTTDIVGGKLSLVYGYSADDLHGRVLTGSIEVAAAIDGVVITPDIRIHGARGEITVVLRRQEYPDAGEHRLAVTLSLSATATGFVLGDPSSITTPFSFASVAVPDAVVTLSGPDLVVTTDIVGGKLSLVYGYSADDLHGRVLTGSIEVAAAIDGEVITPDIRIHGARGEITVVLRRQEYPDAGEHRLAVTLSLSATATGFVLGDPSSITTPFSFASVAVPDAVVTLSGPDLVVTTDIVGGKLSLVYGYSADDLHGRVLTGSIEVAAAIDGEVITPDIRIHGARGEITVVLRRQEYPDDGEHQLAVTLSLSATATGFALGDPSSITTPFSFASVAVPDAVVTLSGPDLVVTTDIVGGRLSLVYGYSADDLHGRVLTGSIEVAAAIDGEVITPDIRIHGAIGEITIILSRAEYPEPGEHRLAVTLSLSATATGFALGDPSSITTPFSFASVAVPDAVVTLSGPDLVVTTDIVGGRLSLVYGYSADDLHGRVLTGSIEVAAAIDGEAITPDIRIHGAIGEITIILSRAEYPESGEHRLAVTLSLSTAAEGFVLGDPSSITTPFSFASVAVPDTVVTLSGPESVAATYIIEGKLSLVYGYSADDLHGRVLTGSIEVAAAIDGVVITPDIRIHGARGEITVVLRRQEYPDAGGHELAVTLSLSATATGFVLGDPSSITTPFSFGSVAVPDTVVTLSGPEPVAATYIVGGELRLVYSYSADDLHGRVLTGSIEVAAAIDGEVITPDIRIHGAIGEITIILSRAEYPEPGEHLLVVTLNLSAAASGFVLGGPSSITTTFRFALISTAIAEDGTCQLGMLGPGESCLYRGSSHTMRVLEARTGPRVFFFGFSEVGKPLNLQDVSNPMDPFDFNVYNLEAIMEGRGYRIIRIYNAPAYSSGKLSGSLDGATLLLAVLFFFANLSLSLAGGRRRQLWRWAGS